MMLNSIVLTLLTLNGATAFLSRSRENRPSIVLPVQQPSPSTSISIENAALRPLPRRLPFWVGNRLSSSLEAAKIIIAGAPASGKGTQCEKIKESFGVVHLSTGDMLRAAVAAGTDVGKEAKSYMDSGKLVPDSTIIGVVSTLILVVVDKEARIPLTRFYTFVCPGERSFGR